MVTYLNETEVQQTVQTLADQIRKDYAGKTVVLVAVLKGAYAFTADLMRALRMDTELEFVRLSRQNETVILIKDISRDIAGAHVLIVDVMIESGKTSGFLYDRLIQSKPATLEVVTLFHKRGKRTTATPVKYVGKEVGDERLMGYGLDDENEGFRNLPSVALIAE